MQTSKEYIQCQTERVFIPNGFEERIVEDAWECLCGNTCADYGFSPCDALGHIAETAAEEETTNWRVCDKCGRIVDQRTLEIGGRRISQ
jgi:hypothetical protein